MILGIKTGFTKSSLDDLTNARPAFSEVWFNILKKNDYTNLFSHAKKCGIKLGLHFWGHTEAGIWTNLAYPNQTLIDTSMALIKETIDIAAKNNCIYVNIHPGCQAMVSIDFTNEQFKLLSEPIPYEQSRDIFLENVCTLYEYAKNRNILFTVETIPSRVSNDWHDISKRTTPINIHELPITCIFELAQRNFTIANDFGHTAASIISDNSQAVWEFVHTSTITLQPMTKLIHLGFITRPFNGTDAHDQIDNPILETDNAVPNYAQMEILFKLFTQRPDVHILVEPNGRHVENYIRAKKLLQNAGVFDE